MIINHPLLGPRDMSEFIYYGDASLLKRPKWDDKNAEDKFYKYLYLRKNVAGIHKELWFHQEIRKIMKYLKLNLLLKLSKV